MRRPSTAHARCWQRRSGSWPPAAIRPLIFGHGPARAPGRDSRRRKSQRRRPLHKGSPTQESPQPGKTLWLARQSTPRACCNRRLSSVPSATRPVTRAVQPASNGWSSIRPPPRWCVHPAIKWPSIAAVRAAEDGWLRLHRAEDPFRSRFERPVNPESVTLGPAARQGQPQLPIGDPP